MSAIFAWLSGHALLAILTFAAAATFVWLLAARKRLKMPWYVALILAILHVAYGVFCVRIFARMEGAGSGAMSLFGAVFFMPIGYWLGAKLFKRPPAEVFDLFAVPMIFTLMCARVNCLIAGCCAGRQITMTSPLRWPTREAELLFYVVFLALMAPRVRRDETKGVVYPLYLIAYGAFRAIVECFRVSSTNQVFHLSHVWALLALSLGLSIYAEMRKRSSKGKTKS